jgi:phosphate starvation-inducible PhoH-like protein
VARTPPGSLPLWRRQTSSSNKLEFADARRLHELFGSHDRNIKALEASVGVNVSLTGDGVAISGDDHDIELAGRVIEQLYQVLGEGHSIDPEDVNRAVDMLSRDRKVKLREVMLDPVLVTSGRNGISAKTINQRRYVEAMRSHDIVFAIGPAGTGKTYLAMAMAISELLKGRYDRIILTRPAVEAGERLGFLPGDLAEKVNPYLRPLYDALYDMVHPDKAEQMIERNVVEVAPLAFMRGRTLNKAFVILDEAQNTTPEQMKMFLTRLGFNSCAVITGDITQVDLPPAQVSGLRHARDILGEIPDLSFVAFDQRDVVRHPLVKKIITAYEKAGGRTPDRSDSGDDS